MEEDMKKKENERKQDRAKKKYWEEREVQV